MKNHAHGRKRRSKYQRRIYQHRIASLEGSIEERTEADPFPGDFS